MPTANRFRSTHCLRMPAKACDRATPYLGPSDTLVIVERTKAGLAAACPLANPDFPGGGEAPAQTPSAVEKVQTPSTPL